MSFKENVEKHPLTYALVLVISTATLVWPLSEIFRVVPLTNKIAEIEKKNSDLEKQLSEWSAAVRPFKSDQTRLLNEKSNLEKQLDGTQKTLDTWRSSHVGLQHNLDLCTSNSSILLYIRAVETSKRQAEASLESALSSNSFGSEQRAREFRRQGEEYHARLLQLQNQLSCASR